MHRLCWALSALNPLRSRIVSPYMVATVLFPFAGTFFSTLSCWECLFLLIYALKGHEHVLQPAHVRTILPSMLKLSPCTGRGGESGGRWRGANLRPRKFADLTRSRNIRIPGNNYSFFSLFFSPTPVKSCRSISAFMCMKHSMVDSTLTAETHSVSRTGVKYDVQLNREQLYNSQYSPFQWESTDSLF